jgi:hypothetical protein
MNRNEISAEEFDRKFDEGQESIIQYLDTENAHRPGLEAQCVNVDFPAWMVSAMDKEAASLGVSRQALIKFIINGHLRG